MTAAACAALGVSRASVQRRRARLTASDIIWSKPNPMPESVTDRPTPAHEHVFLLTKAARYLLHAPRFADQAPAEIYASLLDDGVYHCSFPRLRPSHRIVSKMSLSIPDVLFQRCRR